MEIKTESGVLIKIIAEGSSKVMFFDKPVRAVELKRHELSRVRALLASASEFKKSPDMVQNRRKSPTK